MADWFKFYENDLDETRFQYAIHQLVEVCPVWVGILSECCRHKSDTIRWGNNEIELFGFSQRLNVSVPKVDEAIKILVDIDYISRGENTLKVLKWKDKQSDYCQRLNRTTPNSVRTVSEQCSLRGEERRGDKSTKVQSPNGSLLFECEEQKAETVESWLAILQASEAYRAFDVKAEYSKAGFWCSEKRRKLTKRFFLGWMNRQEKPLPIVANGNGRLAPIDKAILLDDRRAAEDRLKTIRSQYDGHQTWSTGDRNEAKELKLKIAAINQKIGLSV